MKKIYMVALLAGSMSMMAQSSEAQILKNILSNSTVKDVITSVTGGQKVTVSNLEGTWTYSSPAVSLKSDNVLTSAAGSVATAQVEKKLSSSFKKLGITADGFGYTFNSDSTFTTTYKGRSYSGNYSVDQENKTVTLNYTLLSTIQLASMKANVELLGSDMSLLFDADKLLNFLTKVTALTNNSTLNTISKLSEQYDGMQIGFKRQK